MRHRKSFNHLSRTTSHRKAMLSNMAASLILHKRIKTTTAKAKALRIYVEPLITKSKDDSTHSRRVVFGYLQNKDAVTELFREVSPKIIDRPGGYTRILKMGNRMGDNADMCIIELVDYNENLLKASEDAQAKSGRRRRRGGKKKTDEAQTQGAIEQTDVVIREDETKEEVQTPREDSEIKASSSETTESPAMEEKTEEPPGAEKADSDVDTPIGESSPETKSESEDSDTKTEEAVEDKAEDKVEAKKDDAKVEDKKEDTDKDDESEETKKE